MKLIKLTDSHYIIVDDSEVKFGDWYYKQNLNIITKKHYSSPEGDVDLKITHSTQPLSEECKTCTGYCEQCVDGTKPLSLSEVKELIGKVNVEKKAQLVIMNYLTNSNPNGDFKKSTIGADDYKNWWINGYNQCLEDNKEKKYTEADLKRAFFNGGNMKEIEEFNYFIKSLQPKTEWDVEFTDGKIKLK